MQTGTRATGNYTPNATNRLTSTEQFNKDAEMMYDLKQWYMKICARVSEYGVGRNGRRSKLSATIFEYIKETAEALKKRTWGVWDMVTEMKNTEVREIWIRKIGGTPERVLFDDKTLNDLIEKGLNDYEYSEIYK